jgi:hypothetical protein
VGKYLEIAQAVATRRQREGLCREEEGRHPLAPVLPSVDADTETAVLCVSPDMALEDLLEPAHIWSDILQEDFWVCATRAQAAPLLADGKTVYLPAEIRVLRQLKARWSGSFAEKLKAVHQSKLVFGALVVHAALPEGKGEGSHE